MSNCSNVALKDMLANVVGESVEKLSQISSDSSDDSSVEASSDSDMDVDEFE